MDVSLFIPYEVTHFRGTWVAQSVKCLPSVQVMISGSWGRAPR